MKIPNSTVEHLILSKHETKVLQGTKQKQVDVLLHGKGG